MKKRHYSFTPSKILASLTLAIVALVMFGFSANAQNIGDVFMVDNICYRINSGSDKTVEIVANPDTKAVYGSVVIPETVEFMGNSYSVTEIGRRAFFKNEYIKSVTIPSSVKIIKDEAFTRCEFIIDFKFSEGLVEIGDKAFLKCEGLTKIDFPQSLRIIGNEVFNYCSKLEVINFPENIEKIGNLGNCPWFENLPYGENYVGKVFLTYKVDANTQNDKISLKIKEGTTCVSIRACDRFDALDSVTLPKSIKYICGRAFYSCSNLKNVTFEGTDNLIYIGDAAFYETPWEMQHEYGDFYIGKVYYQYKYDYEHQMPENTTINIKEGTVAIAESAIRDQSNLVGINIPNSVKYIYKDALRTNENLTHVTLPDSITFIAEGLFSDNSKLASVKLPAGVKSIGNFAFSFTGLKSIEIPDSCSYIHEATFAMTESLESYTVAEKNPYFSAVDGVLFSKDKKTLIRYPNRRADYVIPEGTEAIASLAFGESEITGLTMPASLVSIGEQAFRRCSNLASVKFVKDSKIKEIPDQTFGRCGMLSSVVLPDSLKVIGSSAFFGCDALNEINLPATLEYIGGRALSGTGWESNQPDGVIYIGNFAYDLKGESTADVVIKEGTTHIVDGFGRSNTGIRTLTLPSSLRVIENPLLACDSLLSVTGGENARLIGKNSFVDTKWLNDQLNGEPVYWNGNVITLDNIFPENYELNFKKGTRSVILNINKRGEAHPENLVAVKFPESIEYIEIPENKKFLSIEKITIENPVPPVVVGNFNLKNYQNAKLYVPTHGLEAYKTTLPWCLFSNILADPTSGVECIQTPETDNIRIFADGNAIVVEGVEEGTQVEVFNLNGQAVYRGVETLINVADKGIYLVRVEGKAYKVAM